jgi:hypothetical protein
VVIEVERRQGHSHGGNLGIVSVAVAAPYSSSDTVIADNPTESPAAWVWRQRSTNSWACRRCERRREGFRPRIMKINVSVSIS